MKGLNIFQLNIFNVLYFMYNCKQKLLLPVFAIFLPTEQKPNMRSEMKLLFKNLYAEEILVSIAFHAGNPLWNKIVISKNLTFGNSDSFQLLSLNKSNSHEIDKTI